MSKDDDGREEYEEGNFFTQLISLLIGLGILVYVGISQPFGQKIIGPMNIPVLSEMVHDKIGEKLLNYTVDGQKFLNDCGGGVATTPYTYLTTPSSLPPNVSLVHAVIPKGGERVTKTWAYNWESERYEDWGMKFNDAVLYEGGAPKTRTEAIAYIEKAMTPELMAFCAK